MVTIWTDYFTMNSHINNFFEHHNRQIEKLNNQRRYWLYASSVVSIGIIFLIFGWGWIDQLHSAPLWWVIASSMLIISANWWYWTMKVIRIILTHQQAEYHLLQGILIELNEFKNDIKPLANRNVDKSK